MSNTLLSIQIIPQPPNGESSLPYIERAIEIIQNSGLPYRVGPLETTVEGELNQLLSFVSSLVNEMTQMNCSSVLSQIKIFHKPVGISVKELMQKYED
jgi:uncharacterized protein YqgV (UPF0045/DUF77 family)